MTSFAVLDARLDAAVMRRLADTVCHVGEVTFPVAFERVSQQVLLGQGGGIDAIQNTALAAVGAVTSAGVGFGSAVTIKGVTYYVLAVRPVGEGLVALELSEEPV